MKRIVRHSVLTILLLSILLGSAGIAVSEEFCLVAGVKTAMLPDTAKECCEDENSAGEEADECCAEALDYEKLEPVSTLKTYTLQLPVYFHTPIKPVAIHNLANLAAEQRIYTYSDSSPPVYGRRLLHRLHILQV